jgi:hypothetical protein
MRHGYRIRRSSWTNPSYVYHDSVSGQICVFVKAPTYSIAHALVLSVDELLATDWELIIEGVIKDFPVTYSD